MEHTKCQCRTVRTRHTLFNPNLYLIIISNLFPQFLTQIRAGTAHTTAFDKCLHAQWRRTHTQPQGNLLSYTEQGTNGTSCSGLRRGLPYHLTVGLRRTRRPRVSPADGGRLLASPPGEAVARWRRAVRLGPHGLRAGSALTGADCWSPGNGPGVRCRAIHFTVLGPRRFHSLESSCRM